MSKNNSNEGMTPLESRASAGLSTIFALRMLGLFLILPVFAIYAEHLPGGQSHLLIGLALGAYGLTQAIFQIPFGMASDRFGRKRVIYFGLLLFALGSFVAAGAHTLYMVIFGRALQGSGAVAAAVIALTADLTREEHRTKAMAMIGVTIGTTFTVSLIVGPALDHAIGVPGIFALTGVLAFAGMAVLYAIVPNPTETRFHSDAEMVPARVRDVLRDPQLLRLDFGIFTLHAILTAMFVVIPFALRRTGNLPVNQHWEVYLPVMLISFALMVPAIIIGEKKGKLKQVLVFAVGLLTFSQFGLVFLVNNFWGIALLLLAFFIAFNVLEASLPSLISKIAPGASKGTAIGVYNTAEFFGAFLGGTMGGFLSGAFGPSAVFLFSGGLAGLWLLMSLTMKTPPKVSSKMFHLPEMDAKQAQALSDALAALPGVAEVAVVAEENVAYLKVRSQEWDEVAALKVITGR